MAARDAVLSRGAGVAFFGVLAFFPLVGALLATLTLVLEPNEIRAQIDLFVVVLPPATLLIIQSQADVMSADAALDVRVVAVIGYVGLLTAARRGMALFLRPRVR